MLYEVITFVGLGVAGNSSGARWLLTRVGKVGDVVLRAGDTLLLESRPSFITQQRNSRDFLLVSEVQGAALPRHDRAWVAVSIV